MSALEAQDSVVVQMLRNTAACLAENAILMRALLPGAPKVDGGKKKRKRRASGDLDESEAKPKKALSGYIYFVQQMRPSVVARESNAPKSPMEVMKDLGSAWKDLTAEEKESWKKRAKEASAELGR